LLKQIADAACAAKKPASVCGEMASEPLSAFLLIGLGYETLSVAPPSLPRIRWLVRQLSHKQAVAAAAAALDARTDAEVLEILRAGVAACGVDPTLL
jgi:phosphotransferase system enzyme I (PtsP)